MIVAILMLLAANECRADGGAPHARIVDIWAYGDIVTDSATLSHKQNNLRIYCGTVEDVPFEQLEYLFMLEGRDKEWFVPFPEGWYFYTDLPPGSYVFHAKCRMKSGEWGAEVIHPFTIRSPWWQTWWAKTCYALLASAIILYILYLLREKIRLHNRLRVEQETKLFRDEFILQAARGFHAPLSIIRSIAEKQRLNITRPLSKTDIQHLRNSSRQMMEMAENLIEFRQDNTTTPYFAADDVIEMREIPLNPRKVLLVVPDESLADVVERDLLRIFKVARCTEKDIIGTVERERPDAAVIDTCIQEANPFELPGMIKRKHPAVVVLLSDFLTSKDLLRAVRSEADDFVRKPFNSQYLTALIVKRVKEMNKYPHATQAENKDKHETAEDIAGNAHNAAAPENGRTTTGIIEKRGDKLFLERLEAIVNGSLPDKDFDVNALAAKMKVSRAQLNIMAKRLTGIPPSQYIRNQRLSAAATLIESTSLTIQEIMFRVGMTDANYFYLRFKEKYGTTPNAYRK